MLYEYQFFYAYSVWKCFSFLLKCLLECLSWIPLRIKLDYTHEILVEIILAWDVEFFCIPWVLNCYSLVVPFVFSIYVVPSIRFQPFFVQAFKIVVDSWKFSMLLLNILWDDWSIFMISVSNEHLQQELEYTLQKPDCHRWWISKMQSGCEDTWGKTICNKILF